MSINSPAFKGIYKVTLPNAKEAKNEKEKAAYTDVILNTVVMSSNASVAAPKIDAAQKNMYFKIDDKNDTNYEKGFANILENCNKQFNIDMAKKAYYEKVSEEEYNKALPLE